MSQERGAEELERTGLLGVRDQGGHGGSDEEAGSFRVGSDLRPATSRIAVAISPLVFLLSLVLAVGGACARLPTATAYSLSEYLAAERAHVEMTSAALRARMELSTVFALDTASAIQYVGEHDECADFRSGALHQPKSFESSLCE